MVEILQDISRLSIFLTSMKNDRVETGLKTGGVSTWEQGAKGKMQLTSPNVLQKCWVPRAITSSSRGISAEEDPRRSSQLFGFLVTNSFLGCG